MMPYNIRLFWSMKTVVKRKCANCTDELRMRRVLSSSSCEYSSQAVWRRHELWGLDMSRERKLSKKLLSSSRCWSLSAICNIGKLDRSWDTLLHYNMLLHTVEGWTTMYGSSLNLLNLGAALQTWSSTQPQPPQSCHGLKRKKMPPAPPGRVCPV